jgi:hypothetical protein
MIDEKNWRMIIFLKNLILKIILNKTNKNQKNRKNMKKNKIDGLLWKTRRLGVRIEKQRGKEKKKGS